MAGTYWIYHTYGCGFLFVGRDPVERARAREIKNHPLCGWSQGDILVFAEGERCINGE